MLEYIIFSQGSRKTRTSADTYSPLVANRDGPGCLREATERFLPLRLWRLEPNTEQVNRLFRRQTSGPVTPDYKSHDGAEEQPNVIEVIESYRQRGRGRNFVF